MHILEIAINGEVKQNTPLSNTLLMIKVLFKAVKDVIPDTHNR